MSDYIPVCKLLFYNIHSSSNGYQQFYTVLDYYRSPAMITQMSNSLSMLSPAL